MTKAEFYTVIIAAFALFVAIASFILSLFAFRKDNERLAARSWFYPAHEGMPRHIKVEAVNKGRRPIILTALGANYEDGNWRNMCLGHPDRGIQLNEKERHSWDMEDIGFLIFDAESSSAAVEFWFEDTIGKRYGVKGSKRHLESYFQQKGDN